MVSRKIATRSLVPALALGAAGIAPATASAALAEGNPQTHSTRAEWEQWVGSHPEGGRISPDLCREKCSPKDETWGAYSHGRADAFEHGDYSEISILCTRTSGGSKRGEAQWYCGGVGFYQHKEYGWYVYLSPYGYSVGPHNYEH